MRLLVVLGRLRRGSLGRPRVAMLNRATPRRSQSGPPQQACPLAQHAAHLAVNTACFQPVAAVQISVHAAAGGPGITSPRDIPLLAVTAVTRQALETSYPGSGQSIGQHGRRHVRAGGKALSAGDLVEESRHAKDLYLPHVCCLDLCMSRLFPTYIMLPSDTIPSNRLQMDTTAR